jgi:hypothetical protein
MPMAWAARRVDGSRHSTVSPDPTHNSGLLKARVAPDEIIWYPARHSHSFIPFRVQ